MTKSLTGLLFLLCLVEPSHAQVMITEADYEGAPHFVIRTKAATYWYDRAGGGLSRMIDREGNDWISFRREPWGKTPDSAASAYRGIPNFVFGSEDGGAGHPGFTKCESHKIGDNAITTVSKSGKWRWTWTFAEDQRQIEQMRWVYFGDDNSRRALFIAQNEGDNIPDVFGVMGGAREGLNAPDGMTVFGFGRSREAKCLLRAAPQSFTLGFYEEKITDERRHAALARRIASLLNQ